MAALAQKSMYGVQVRSIASKEHIAICRIGIVAGGTVANLEGMLEFNSSEAV